MTSDPLIEEVDEPYEEQDEGQDEDEVVEIPIPALPVITFDASCVGDPRGIGRPSCSNSIQSGSRWFATRKPHVWDTEEHRIVGYRCEECQPLEGVLMEPLVQALSARRWDEATIRQRMRLIGEERLYEQVVGPTLDLVEVILQLKR